MLRLLSSEAQERKYFRNPSEPSCPCHVGIHLISPTNYSQMSTQAFSKFPAFWHHLYWPKLATGRGLTLNANNIPALMAERSKACN